MARRKQQDSFIADDSAPAPAAARTEAGVLLDAGRTLAKPHVVDGIPVLVLPEGTEWHPIEALLKQPQQVRGTCSFIEPDSFTRYVKDFKGAASRIFADPDDIRITAVLDYHQDRARPHWGRHRAVCTLPLDPDFAAWKGNDGGWFAQSKFAAFIEQMVPTISEPDGADVLEIAQHLEATRSVSFKSAQRLHDGNRAFKYEEETQGAVSRREIAVPESFRLRLRVFRWSDHFDIEAKLRYRLDEGRLLLSYTLMRLQDTLDDAFKSVCKCVHVDTGIQPLYGPAPPETPRVGMP